MISDQQGLLMESHSGWVNSYFLSLFGGGHPNSRSNNFIECCTNVSIILAINRYKIVIVVHLYMPCV